MATLMTPVSDKNAGFSEFSRGFTVTNDGGYGFSKTDRSRKSEGDLSLAEQRARAFR